jgi:hypothetical protein
MTAPSAPRSAIRPVDVDHRLCSWAWVEPAFSRYVYAELLHTGLRALAPEYGVDHLALARHAVAARRHRAVVIWLAVADLFVFVFGVPVVVLAWLPHPGGAVLAAAVSPLVAVVGLFVLIGRYLYVSRSRASTILRSPDAPRELAPALDSAVERRLADNADANAVVFGGGVPFVGAGVRLERWKVRVDTTRPGTDGQGRRRTIRPLSPETLQKNLTTTVRRAGIQDLEVHNRLFVAGNFVAGVPGLLPDRYAPPRPSIERAEVRRGIEDANEGARTYLCVTKKSWAGELVVTNFVRVGRLINDLFVEFHAFVLLPLAPVVRIVDDYPVTRVRRLTSVLRDVLPTTYRLVRGAPATAVELARWRLRLVRRTGTQRRFVRTMAHFNYGALRGIHATLAARQRERTFTYEDEDTYLQALRTLVFNTIVATVKDHGIDTSDLERQEKTIINKTYRIGDVKGRNVMIGDNATFNGGLPDVMDDNPDDDQDGQDDDTKSA